MVWKAKALFDYEAADTDELSFKEGELITITEKSDTWWTGELNGKSGSLPSNFVELVEDEPEPVKLVTPKPAPQGAGVGVDDELAARLKKRQSNMGGAPVHLEKKAEEPKDDIPPWKREQMLRKQNRNSSGSSPTVAAAPAPQKEDELQARLRRRAAMNEGGTPTSAAPTPAQQPASAAAPRGKVAGRMPVQSMYASSASSGSSAPASGPRPGKINFAQFEKKEEKPERAGPTRGGGNVKKLQGNLNIPMGMFGGGAPPGMRPPGGAAPGAPAAAGGAETEEGAPKAASEPPKYRVTTTYTAEDEGEISLEEGTEVVVEDKSEDWWTVKHGEETGKFPSNHLEEIKAAGFCDDQVSQKPRLAAVKKPGPARNRRPPAKKTRPASVEAATETETEAVKAEEKEESKPSVAATPEPEPAKTVTKPVQHAKPSQQSHKPVQQSAPSTKPATTLKPSQPTSSPKPAVAAAPAVSSTTQDTKQAGKHKAKVDAAFESAKSVNKLASVALACADGSVYSVGHGRGTAGDLAGVLALNLVTPTADISASALPDFAASAKGPHHPSTANGLAHVAATMAEKGVATAFSQVEAIGPCSPSVLFSEQPAVSAAVYLIACKGLLKKPAEDVIKIASSLRAVSLSASEAATAGFKLTQQPMSKQALEKQSSSGMGLDLKIIPGVGCLAVVVPSSDTKHKASVAATAAFKSF